MRTARDEICKFDERGGLRSANEEIATAGPLSAKDSPELRVIISMACDMSPSSFSRPFAVSWIILLCAQLRKFNLSLLLLLRVPHVKPRLVNFGHHHIDITCRPTKIVKYLTSYNWSSGDESVLPATLWLYRL